MPDIQLVQEEKEGWHELDAAAAAAVQVEKFTLKPCSELPQYWSCPRGPFLTSPEAQPFSVSLRCTDHSSVFC